MSTVADPATQTAEVMPRLWWAHRLITDIQDGVVHLDHDTDAATINGTPVTGSTDDAITELMESGLIERLPCGQVTLTMTGICLAQRWRSFAVYTAQGGDRCA